MNVRIWLQTSVEPSSYYIDSLAECIPTLPARLTLRHLTSVDTPPGRVRVNHYDQDDEGPVFYIKCYRNPNEGELIAGHHTDDGRLHKYTLS